MNDMNNAHQTPIETAVEEKISAVLEGIQTFFSQACAGINRVVSFFEEVGQACHQFLDDLHTWVEDATNKVTGFIAKNQVPIIHFFKALQDPYLKDEVLDLWVIGHARYALAMGDDHILQEGFKDFCNIAFVRGILAKRSIDASKVRLYEQMRLAFFETMQTSNDYHFGFTTASKISIAKHFAQQVNYRAFNLAIEEYLTEYPFETNKVCRKKASDPIYYDDEMLCDYFLNQDVTLPFIEEEQVAYYKVCLGTMLDQGDLPPEQAIFAMAAIHGQAEKPIDLIKITEGLNHTHWQALIRKVKRRFG